LPGRLAARQPLGLPTHQLTRSRALAPVAAAAGLAARWRPAARHGRRPHIAGAGVGIVRALVSRMRCSHLHTIPPDRSPWLYTIVSDGVRLPERAVKRRLEMEAPSGENAGQSGAARGRARGFCLRRRWACGRPHLTCRTVHLSNLRAQHPLRASESVMALLAAQLEASRARAQVRGRRAGGILPAAAGAAARGPLAIRRSELRRLPDSPRANERSCLATRTDSPPHPRHGHTACQPPAVMQPTLVARSGGVI
jgi:hypothetical protein